MMRVTVEFLRGDTIKREDQVCLFSRVPVESELIYNDSETFTVRAVFHKMNPTAGESVAMIRVRLA